MSTDTLQIVSFPPDDHIYRLDWFGDVFYQRHIRYKHPFIRVALSQVTPDNTGSWRYPSGFTSSIAQTQTPVAVGMLPMLRIGTLWKNGVIVADPGYSTETFTVLASKGTAKLVKAGVSDEEHGFVLPFEAHPYHKGHTHSYCLRITLASGKVLIIPVVELIRFYFGSSSGLISRLFQGVFTEERFWTAAHLNDIGAANIGLAKGIAGSSATDIARMAFSPDALLAAKLISSSLLASGHSGQAYPKSQFPFSGKTALDVRGVWLSGASPKTFLAFQILSCSYPFPFSSLRYTMQKAQAAKSPDGGPGSDPVTHAARSTEPSGPLTNNPPDSSKELKARPFRARNHFPDLDYKSVARTDPTSQVRIFVAEAGNQPAGTAIGEGEGKSSIQPLDLVAAADAPVPKTHPMAGTAFAEYVDELVRDRLKAKWDVWFVPLDPRQRYPQFSVMPKVVLEDGEIHPLSFIEEGEGQRPRYVAVIKISDGWLDDQVWLVPELGSEAVLDAYKSAMAKIKISFDDSIDAAWVGRQASTLTLAC